MGEHEGFWEEDGVGFGVWFWCRKGAGLWCVGGAGRVKRKSEDLCFAQTLARPLITLLASFFFPAPGFPPPHPTQLRPSLRTPSRTHPHVQTRPKMATWASFTTIDEAITHNLTLALLGLEHVSSFSLHEGVPRYIGLREVPGAQPPDAVLGVCTRGDGSCPGHRLPLHSALQAFACCMECGALIGHNYCPTEILRAAGVVRGTPTPGLTTSKAVRARWIGLRYETQPDDSRLVVGVCHAHITPRGYPGHALALRSLSDATACCGGCGRAVTTQSGVARARKNGVRLGHGTAVLDADGQVTGWTCRVCSRR